MRRGSTDVRKRTRRRASGGKTRTRRRRPAERARAVPRGAAPTALKREVARLRAALADTRRKHARERRAADQQLASAVAEMASLRHHQARAEALTRLLEERDRALAAQSERIARLEGLLQTPPELG